jgi:hypothetical protein
MIGGGSASGTALRLARYFGTTPAFWLNLQTAYDLSLAVAEAGARIEQDVRHHGWINRAGAPYGGRWGSARPSISAKCSRSCHRV